MSDPREVLAAALDRLWDAPATMPESEGADSILSALSEAGYVVVPQADWDAAQGLIRNNLAPIAASLRAELDALAAGTTTPRTGDEEA